MTIEAVRPDTAPYRAVLKGSAGTSLTRGPLVRLSTARRGLEGERAWELALGLTLPRYARYASLDIPQNSPRQTAYPSDVDSIVVSGDRVVLVDVKHWRISERLWCHPQTGVVFAGESPSPHHLGRNMNLALSRYREALPGHRVSALVVYTSELDDYPWTDRDVVAGLRWPGELRAYLVPEALGELRRRLGKPLPPTEAADALLSRMVRS